MFQGSTAVLEQRPSAEGNNFIIERRRQLIADGTLIEKDGFLLFTRDTEFASPSGAAAVIHGGTANGLIAWKSTTGTTPKQLDENS